MFFGSLVGFWAENPPPPPPPDPGPTRIAISSLLSRSYNIYRGSLTSSGSNVTFSGVPAGMRGFVGSEGAGIFNVGIDQQPTASVGTTGRVEARDGSTYLGGFDWEIS